LINKNRFQKRTIAITLVIVWMFYIILRGTLKAINYNRIELNKKIFGTFAIVDYWIDIFILIAFILFVFLFIKRIPKTWKYFIYFIDFLIIGVIIGMVYNLFVIDKIVDVLSVSITPATFLISNVLTSLFFIAFYFLIIYLVYTNRSYFKDAK